MPRAKAAARANQAAPSIVPESGSVSWSTAALVLALFGLAAGITIASVGRHKVPTASAPPPPAYANAQDPVDVTVRAALDRGELFVNGRSYGPLSIEDAVLLQLSPGPYHFEAREDDGTQAGKDVVVHPGIPTEVILIPSTD